MAIINDELHIHGSVMFTVPEFEDVLNSFLHIKNADTYVTGSNAKFLSKDIITEFRGRGDDLHMNQIFIDLLSDDRKFTMACGSVLVRFEQLAEAQEGIAQYRLAVRDSGIGRSEEFPLTYLMPSGGSAPPPWPDLRAPD